MSSLLYNSNHQQIRIPAQPIASGGEGKVYKILNREYSQQCVKIYHEKYRTETRRKKLEYMIAHPPKELYGDTYKICWPQEFVFLAGQFVGFIMPLVYPISILLYELCTTRINSKLPYYWKRKFNRFSENGVKARLKLCVNICIAMDKVYSEIKYVFVDLKPQNIMITLNGQISLIDLDSIQIADDNVLKFHARVSTPEYTPPESKQYQKDDVIPNSWDAFSLAVIFYQVLFGIHPYTATAKPPYDLDHSILYKIQNHLYVHGGNNHQLALIPKPHQNYYLISNELQVLFRTSFDLQVSERPNISEWGDCLFDEISELNVDFIDYLAQKTSTHKYNNFFWFIDNKITLIDKMRSIFKTSYFGLTPNIKGCLITATIISFIFFVVLVVLISISEYDSEFDYRNIQELKKIEAQIYDPNPKEFITIREQPKPINLDQIKEYIIYPQACKDDRIEGKVYIKLLISKDGIPIKHTIERSPHELLTKACLDEIYDLRFTPAIQDGKPIKFWVMVPFKFSLR